MCGRPVRERQMWVTGDRRPDEEELGQPRRLPFLVTIAAMTRVQDLARQGLLCTILLCEQGLTMSLVKARKPRCKEGA